MMHRAMGGSFEGKYVRDMRRATVHDSSSTAWGLNDKNIVRAGFFGNGQPTPTAPTGTAAQPTAVAT